MILPPESVWPEQDKRVVGTHWSFDLGSDGNFYLLLFFQNTHPMQDLTNEMGERYNVSSVASRFSRLFIDPNRPRDSSTLFRDTADGAPILLNTGKLLRQTLRLTFAFFPDRSFCASKRGKNQLVL